MSNKLGNSNPFNIVVIVAALGYFVDIYDLTLFGIVRVPSLKAIGIPDNQIKDAGVYLLNMQMIGMHSQWSIMGMATIPIVPWSSKMYTSETKSIDFQIQSMEKEKQTMELMAKRMQSFCILDTIYLK